MTPLQKQLAQRVGILIGQMVSYRIYRKLGAPRWAALAIADIAGRLALLQDNPLDKLEGRTN